MRGERREWRYGRRWYGAVVVAGMLGVAACSGGDSPTPSMSSSSTTATITAPTPSDSPSPSLTPEQQAAAEAKSAYLNYRTTVSSVFQRGGANARHDLQKVAFGEQLSYLVDSAAEYETKHYRAVGEAAVTSLSVQGLSLVKGKLPQAVLKACVDATRNDAVDRSGHSIRRPGALAHFIELVTLTRFSGKGWLVGQEDDTPVKSC